MIKHVAFTLSALVGFASLSLAANPFDARAISDAPSVLVKTDAAPPAPVASGESAVVHDSAPAEGEKAATDPVSGEAKVADAAPAPATVSSPTVMTESAPVYRSARPSRKQNNGLFSDLIELERKKNAWLRKNILGR